MSTQDAFLMCGGRFVPHLAVKHLRVIMHQFVFGTFSDLSEWFGGQSESERSKERLDTETETGGERETDLFLAPEASV